MSKEDQYYTAPLAILRSGQNPLDTMEACVGYGIVNAGIGYMEKHGQESFDELLEEAQASAVDRGEELGPPKKLVLRDPAGNDVSDERARKLWNSAFAGAKLLGIRGGTRLAEVQTWIKHYRAGEVFFRIRSDLLWGAVCAARREAGSQAENPYKPLSWREFRLLTGILSAKVNSYDFTFCGWEGIQARACGFHNKKLFNEGKAHLPAHCQPLSRQMIRDTTAVMEGLGFFARCRYSSGPRGGMMAYSFRHPNRTDLVAAVGRWREANDALGLKTAAFRTADLDAFKNTKPAPSGHQSNTNISKEQEAKNQGRHQIGHQLNHQHKEKGFEREIPQ